MDPRPDFPEAWYIINKIDPFQVVGEMFIEELQTEFGDKNPTGSCFVCNWEVASGERFCKDCLNSLQSDFYGENYYEVLEVEWELVQANLL